MLVLPFALILLLQFNNCSKYKQPEVASNSIAAGTPLSSVGQIKEMTLTGDVCEDNIRRTFYEGYYQMLTANCIQCHAVDQDKPQFASPDANWAYEVFQTRGYAKISTNATSTTHNPPATGPHLTAEVNDLKVRWRMAVETYNSCKGLPPVVEVLDPREVVNLETAAKSIPALAVGRDTILSWDLNTEIRSLKQTVSVPNFGASARFQIKVTRRQTAAGTDYYTFKDPIIYNNSTDIRAKTIYVKMNGRLLSYVTTYKYTDRGVYANSVNTGTDNLGLLSAGAMMVLGTVSDRDTVSFAFELLQPTTLPAKPPPVTVGFADNSVRFVNSTSTGLDSNRRMRFTVAVNGNAELPIVMTVATVNDALCGATGDNAFVVNTGSCLPSIYNALNTRGIANTNNTRFQRARSIDGGSFNRFDWDYKIINSSFTLLGNNATATFDVEFSGDIRRENNRILRLRLEVLSDYGVLQNQEVAVIIHKADNENALANGEMTYSALMRTGTLKNYCLECHNSRDLNGGYDITDYKLMVTNGVLDLASPITSKMFNRMNPNWPGNETLAPMPRDGYLPDAEIDPVRRWIMSGAKNN